MCAWMVVLLVDDDELQHISSAYDDDAHVVDIDWMSWLKISVTSQYCKGWKAEVRTAVLQPFSRCYLLLHSNRTQE